MLQFRDPRIRLRFPLIEVAAPVLQMLSQLSGLQLKLLSRFTTDRTGQRGNRLGPLHFLTRRSSRDAVCSVDPDHHLA
jgi:hypothetical protein